VAEHHRIQFKGRTDRIQHPSLQPLLPDSYYAQKKQTGCHSYTSSHLPEYVTSRTAIFTRETKDQKTLGCTNSVPTYYKLQSVPKSFVCNSAKNKLKF